MNKDFVSVSAIYDPYLVHSGIKGMKWGIRRYQNPDGTLTEEGRRRYGYSMNPQKSDSKVTQRVKRDFNSMTDNEFRRKYSTSKAIYEKRVRKYGDPYMNAPLAKLGKRMESSRTNRYNKSIQRLQKDAESFDPYVKTGIKTKKGKEILSAKEVSDSRKAILNEIKKLQDKRDRKTFNKYTEKRVNKILEKQRNKQLKEEKNKKYQEQIERINSFVNKYSNTKLSNIDDTEAITIWIHEPEFRKEYGISDSMYSEYLKTMSK